MAVTLLLSNGRTESLLMRDGEDDAQAIVRAFEGSGFPASAGFLWATSGRLINISHIVLAEKSSQDDASS